MIAHIVRLSLSPSLDIHLCLSIFKDRYSRWWSAGGSLEYNLRDDKNTQVAIHDLETLDRISGPGVFSLPPPYFCFFYSEKKLAVIHRMLARVFEMRACKKKKALYVVYCQKGVADELKLWRKTDPIFHHSSEGTAKRKGVRKKCRGKCIPPFLPKMFPPLFLFLF